MNRTSAAAVLDILRRQQLDKLMAARLKLTLARKHGSELAEDRAQAVADFERHVAALELAIEELGGAK